MKFFNQFTDEQIRAQYKRNAKQLKEMAEIAKSKGKYNGYTYQQLIQKAEAAEAKSKGKCNA